ncbi:MAG TPA: SpoIIE family protein phosphatase [Bryobacteraceae bacterium]|jgi:serine phosphatase RsbU (regulator of sigma subunit)|nr:SpoIIE family protein phosphatase [Bryobacteraceae bacterium]
MELVISGPEGSSTKVQLQKPVLSLGRSADNDLAYPDDPWLSRSHLTFEQRDEGWFVKDCASRNGTVLNAATLKEPRRINPGDRIYAGHLTIEVRDPNVETNRPVISFVPQEEERITREATIVTSLDKLLGKSPGAVHGREVSLNTTRVVGALVRAGQELAGHRPLDELFDVILKLSLSAVEAKRGVIMTLEDGELVVRASEGDGFSISTSVRDRILRERCSLIVGDAQQDDALRQQRSIVMHRVRSMMGAPLQTGERVIGLIYVDNAALLRPFSQEDLDLLTVMANVAAIRIEHARLIEVEQSEKLMELELAQASEIQATLLPKEAPPCPGYEIAGHHLPCRTVGGDYYDFVPYNDGRLALVVGDVSGKGLPAALLMSSLQARVQMVRETSPDPAAAVTLLNRNFSERCPAGKFVTFFYALLDPQTGSLTYSNAGHNYPLLLRANGQVQKLSGGGMVLGLFPMARYELRETSLEPGDTLALYSDGVTEALSPLGEEFGEDGLARFLQANKSESCADLVTHLIDHLRAWHRNVAFNDDFTIVLVRRQA